MTRKAAKFCEYSNRTGHIYSGLLQDRVVYFHSI